MPPAVTMNVDLFICIDAGKDQSIAPITILNALVDAGEAAIAPNPLGKQTLGGLVSHCWIEGNIMKNPGDIDAGWPSHHPSQDSYDGVEGYPAPG